MAGKSINGVIRIRGAGEHNLQDVDLDLPQGGLIAMCGVSGSGKSSLAFDTLFAEARRRYLMSLGRSDRQLLQYVKAPRVQSLEGLSPAVAIGQLRGPQNPRSTVATLAGVYDYLRLLFTKLGRPFCVDCGGAVVFQRFEEVLEQAAGLRDGTRLTVMAPRSLDAVDGESGAPGGSTAAFLAWVDRVGYRRIRVDGEMVLIDEFDAELSRARRLEVVVDRIVVKPETRRRLKGALQAAREVGQGRVVLDGGTEEMAFSVSPICSACGASSRSVTPELFSFNSSQGACPTCRGLGTLEVVDCDRLFDQGRAGLEDALGLLWRELGQRELRERLSRFCRARKIDFDAAVGTWPPPAAEQLWNGKGGTGRGAFIGLHRWLEELRRDGGRAEQAWLDGVMGDEDCRACGGSRLVAAARAVQVAGTGIDEVSRMTVGGAGAWLARLKFDVGVANVGVSIVPRLALALETMDRLGLGYLHLGRRSDTLSSGEYQRVRLATALGSGMTQVLYVLDEPSAGLHARDVARLQEAVARLRDRGNTVVLVDHDRAVIETADQVVELGPGAGPHGGRVVATGRPDQVAREDSPTGRFLSGRLELPRRCDRPLAPDGWLTILDAHGHNLRHVTVALPLGNLVAVTGVSGSGKTSLISDTLYPQMARQLQGGGRVPLPSSGCEGADLLERVVAVDQRPIGRNPRSNAATYTGLLGAVRRLFAEVPEAKLRAYTPAHFSFNSTEGACQSCAGRGGRIVRQELFEDLEVVCEACEGHRYRGEGLDVLYRDHNIADVLALTVVEALELFAAIPELARRLGTLDQVGLGYLSLGQPATSFSGGEAQRVKLAAELGRSLQDHTLFILDEPTTGLHQEDVLHLVALLQELVDRHNTVLVIEHQIELIAACDYVVDMGPEGGADGGQIVAVGTPVELAAAEDSVTGLYLRSLVDGAPPRSEQSSRGEGHAGSE